MKTNMMMIKIQVLSLLLFIIGTTLMTISSVQVQAQESTSNLDTCFTKTVAECKEINLKQYNNPRMCIVTLTDGNDITIFRGDKTCSTWQEEIGHWTYHRWQDEKYQEQTNRINEAGRDLRKMFSGK